MPRKKEILTGAWVDNFIETYCYDYTGFNARDILVKKLRQEYTLGYSRASRPLKLIKCSWCGKTTEDNLLIHPSCKEIKEKL